MQVKQQQFEWDMEQETGSKSGKEQVKAVYCHRAYLTYMQSTSCKMLDWMKQISGRNINTLRYADDTTLMAESEEELNSLLIKMKQKEKAGFKLNIEKLKALASSPITSGQIDEETMETVTDFIFLGSKVIADGDCSHEIKKLCSLEEKL